MGQPIPIEDPQEGIRSYRKTLRRPSRISKPQSVNSLFKNNSQKY